jgi:hypothetical protein
VANAFLVKSAQNRRTLAARAGPRQIGPSFSPRPFEFSLRVGKWTAAHLLHAAMVFSAYPEVTAKEIKALTAAAGVTGDTQHLIVDRFSDMAHGEAISVILLRLDAAALNELAGLRAVAVAHRIASREDCEALRDQTLAQAHDKMTKASRLARLKLSGDFDETLAEASSR